MAVADSTWQEIENLVDAIAARAREAGPPAAFYRELLEKCVQATAALGGIVWTRTLDGRFQPEFHQQAAQSGLADDTRVQELHGAVLEAVERTAQTHWVAPDSGRSTGGVATWNREHLLSFTPLSWERELFAVVELFHRPTEDPAMRRGYERLLNMVGELAAEWHRSRRLIELREREQFWLAWDAFTRRVHGQLGLVETASEIANESRRVLAVDRVSVVLREGSACRVLAMSGVDRVERRSNVVRTLERLTCVALSQDSALWFEVGRPVETPQLAEPLRDYLDTSAPRAIAIVPLHAADALGAFAALVVERFTGGMDGECRRRTGIVADHAASALRNAWELSTLPGANWLRALRGADRPGQTWRRRRWFVAIAMGLATCAALTLIPADMTIEAPAAVRPARWRDIFAPADADVAEVLVKHDQSVRAGQELLVLRSPELDLEYRRLTGERDATRERLLAVESARLDDRGRRAERDRDRRDESLSASGEELRQLLASHEKQLEILGRQLEALRVRCPVDGVVLTWNVDELLTARPVQRGQRLLSVAQTSGRWELWLDVADTRIGHVLNAASASDSRLPVEFVPATDPTARWQGQVADIAAVTDVSERSQPFVRVTASLSQTGANETGAKDIRPGATGSARIHCGRRPLGYVWFHGVWEFVQRHWIF